MSTRPDQQVVDQAISWHLRLKDADETAWLEFADWLEADPAHNDAYEQVADEDLRLAPVLESAEFPAVRGSVAEGVANDEGHDDPAPARVETYGGNRAWRWGALAASVAVAGFLALQLNSANDTYTIETAPGETRTIALADGSEIMLNGGTRITLDRANERKAELLEGEANFDVTHDSSAPFTVTSGKSRIVDVGTVFNVVRTDQQIRVAVAEGAVRFEGFSRSTDLKPGDSLSAQSTGSISLVRKPIAAIGSWKQGALVYDQAPLSLVVEDLSRSLGVSLVVPDAMKAQSFSGVIQTKGEQDEVRLRLEQLLGASVHAEGANWTVQQ